MTQEEGIAAMQEVVEVLERRGLRYWLGRGVLRHHTLEGELGDQQGDIDFHVLREDEPGVRRQAVEELQTLGYQVISRPEHSHKITLRKGETEVEFVFLNRDGKVLWHQAGWPQRRRYECPARAFGHRRIQMFGIDVRVPDEEYLVAVFGARWRENVKGSGGTPMGSS